MYFLQKHVAAGPRARENGEMNALSRIGDAPMSDPGWAAELAQPIYFDAGSRRLFGWLHRPRKHADLGLVLCKPFGYEAICAHRGVRSFAEAASAIGVPALRFDYAGTGDSSDIEIDVDQIELWTADIVAAVTSMRRLTGVQRVCVLGFRLGALLAARAACDLIDALALISPVIIGRRYVRDLRVTQLAASLRHGTGSPADNPSSSLGGGVEVAGFSLSAASLATLASIDLEKMAAPTAPDILVIDRSDLPAAKTWTEQASRLGSRTKYLALSGSVEMFLTAPQYGSVPDVMIAATCEWLAELKGAGQPDKIPAVALDASTSEPALSLPQSGSTSGITERPVFFGADVSLFGIVTEPSPGDPARRGVILINAAVDPHFGAGRVYVSLARNWARRGYVVLRMDLAGMADSATRRGRPNDEVFSPEALRDIHAAVSFMSGRYAIQELILGGLCSGGYHALRGAVAGLPVNQIFLINPENYFWKQGATLRDVQLAEAVRNPAIYRERMQSAVAWRRVLTGQVNVWRIFKIYSNRVLLAMESALRDIARWLRIRLPSDLGSELEGLCARGVQVVFVFARGEPGIELLKLLAGATLSRLATSCRVHVIEGGDHTFSTRGPRETCEAILTDELMSHPVLLDSPMASCEAIRPLREKER